MLSFPDLLKPLFLLSLLFLFLTNLSSASPIAAPLPSSTPGPDQGLTIWPKAALDTMKAQRENLYQYGRAMYDHKDYFDNADHCVNPTIPDPKYAVGAPCPRANLLATGGIERILKAWGETCKVLYPTHYNLPDNSFDPKASFSDFAHFLNSMNGQISYIFEAAAYLACKYDFDLTSTAFTTAENNYYAAKELITSGPQDPTTFGSVNGTESIYFDSNQQFWQVVEHSYGDVENAWGDFQVVVEYNDIGQFNSCPRCVEFEKQGGLREPRDVY